MIYLISKIKITREHACPDVRHTRISTFHHFSEGRCGLLWSNKSVHFGAVLWIKILCRRGRRWGRWETVDSNWITNSSQFLKPYLSVNQNHQFKKTLWLSRQNKEQDSHPKETMQHAFDMWFTRSWPRAWFPSRKQSAGLSPSNNCFSTSTNCKSM